MAKEYDPQMHTAEHVLNQTMVRMFECGRCYSAHLNPGKSKCDYRFTRALADEEASALEDAVNDVLRQNLPVTERFVPRMEAEKLVDLGKLPGSVGPEALIRLVSIGDYDFCPCIGAHVGKTGEVGAFRMISHEFNPDTGVLRLRFRLGQS